jgi:glycosyltransferase involved in cell wall biosynthesis
MLPVKEFPRGVSLVICTYNGAARITKTLEHILKQEVGAAIPWEVILVDNGSTDHTDEVARAAWKSGIPFKIIREMRRGVTFARATGVENAAYEYVSYIDDDNRIAPDWVTVLYHTFSENPGIGMCGGQNEGVYEIPPPAWFEPVRLCYAVGAQGTKTSDITDSKGLLWGAGMSFRKSCYLNVISLGFRFHADGKPGSVVRGEDTELSVAFMAAGYRLWYVEALRLQHFMPAGRLKWEYAVSLFKGLGEFEFLLDLYRNAIRNSRFPMGRIYVSLAGYSLVYFGWRLANITRKQENNPRYLSYIDRKVYIFTALRSFSQSREKLKQIREFIQRAKENAQTL